MKKNLTSFLSILLLITLIFGLSALILSADESEPAETVEETEPETLPPETLPPETDPSSCKIYYYDRGIDGTGTSFLPHPKPCAVGDTVELLSNPFAHEGMTFLYWTINGTSYQPGESYVITGDTDIVAFWETTQSFTTTVENAKSARLNLTGGRSVTFTAAYEPLTVNGEQITVDGQPVLVPANDGTVMLTVWNIPADFSGTQENYGLTVTGNGAGEFSVSCTDYKATAEGDSWTTTASYQLSQSAEDITTDYALIHRTTTGTVNYTLSFSFDCDRTDPPADAPYIVTQPEDVHTANGKEVVFTVVAFEEGLDPQGTPYQWYRMVNGNAEALTDGEQYAGTKTAVLTVRAFEFNCQHDGELFYCVVTNKDGISTTSRYATYHAPHIATNGLYVATDEKEHYHVCACGEKMDVEKHTFDPRGICLYCGRVTEGTPETQSQTVETSPETNPVRPPESETQKPIETETASLPESETALPESETEAETKSLTPIPPKDPTDPSDKEMNRTVGLIAVLLAVAIVTVAVVYLKVKEKRQSAVSENQ